MDKKKINFDCVEMLANLQADINQTILTKTLNKQKTFDDDNARKVIDLIGDIQKDINETLKQYLDYILNR